VAIWVNLTEYYNTVDFTKTTYDGRGHSLLACKGAVTHPISFLFVMG